MVILARRAGDAFGALWHVARPGYKTGHYKPSRYGSYKAKSGGSYGSMSHY